MCFVKSSATKAVETATQPQETVLRHEADASVTKNTQQDSSAQGFKQNIRTSALGIQEAAQTDKKTLLGE